MSSGRIQRDVEERGLPEALSKRAVLLGPRSPRPSKSPHALLYRQRERDWIAINSVPRRSSECGHGIASVDAHLPHIPIKICSMALWLRDNLENLMRAQAMLLVGEFYKVPIPQESAAGKTGQASYFEHHGKQVSSTNHFNYYLFCGTCEDRKDMVNRNKNTASTVPRMLEAYFKMKVLEEDGRERDSKKETTSKRKYHVTDAFDSASGNARKYMKVFNRKTEVKYDITGGESDEDEDEAEVMEETEEVPSMIVYRSTE